MHIISKPQPGEYRLYAATYINQLSDSGITVQQLQENFNAVQSLIAPLPEETLLYRYAPDKWTIKEVLVHIMDAERIFACRALRIARSDKTNLAGFEQNDYVPCSYANERSIESILTEYELLRSSTVVLFRNFNINVFAQTGSVDGQPVSVRALFYQVAGHELHHVSIIKERYLV